MKQNEKVLVYAVTGFLLVILGVAILFGKDGPRRAPEPQKQQTASGEQGLPDWLAKMAKDQEAPKANVTGLPAPEDKPLVAPPPPNAAEQVVLKFGDSRRDGSFRVVKAGPGDSLGKLTQRWFGNTKMLEQIKSLNEDLKTLRPGQEVWVPWVDDEALLADWQQRHQDTASPPVVDANTEHAAERAPADASAPAPAKTVEARAPVPVASRTYKLQSGDKLWSIAVREAGAKGAPAFLEKVKQLNPNIADINSVRVGQELKLPPKG